MRMPTFADAGDVLFLCATDCFRQVIIKISFSIFLFQRQLRDRAARRLCLRFALRRSRFSLRLCAENVECARPAIFGTTIGVDGLRETRPAPSLGEVAGSVIPLSTYVNAQENVSPLNLRALGQCCLPGTKRAAGISKGLLLRNRHYTH